MALVVAPSATVNSTVVRDYAYIVCRLKFDKESNYHPSSLFCHYGATNDIFPIGGLVDIGETPNPSLPSYAIYANWQVSV
jgi:hypothetical protein